MIFWLKTQIMIFFSFWGHLRRLFSSHYGKWGPLKIGGPGQMSTLPVGKDGPEIGNTASG